MVKTDVSTFQNDMVNFAQKDDVLTYLIHLGYLAYDQEKECAFVPNEEIRQELAKAVRRKKWSELLHFWQESENLLQATLDEETESVAEQMERIHTEYASAIQYNNENSLSGVVTLG